MPDFKAKMYQIQFRLGLHPRPRWGNLQRSTRPHSCIKGTYTYQFFVVDNVNSKELSSELKTLVSARQIKLAGFWAHFKLI